MLAGADRPRASLQFRKRRALLFFLLWLGVDIDYEFGPAQESHLVAVLRELDTSKAFVRKAQAELANASADLIRQRSSPQFLASFATLNRNLSEALESYRVAIQAFNVVCRNKVMAAVA